MPGMQKILRGVIQYRKTVRKDLLSQFQRIRDNPEPKAVMFTCMDSRMLPMRFTTAQVGDMFVVRNAGNMIPHAATYGHAAAEVSVTTEPAALELACVRGHIRNVVVCGHADCKAINALHEIQEDPKVRLDSPFELWLRRHGYDSIQKFNEHMKNGANVALKFECEGNEKMNFEAFIDRANKLRPLDKLSQVHCLQQLENVGSHPILQPLLREGRVDLHALWFDIYSGEVFCFSREQKEFVQLTEETIDPLLKEFQFMSDR